MTQTSCDASCHCGSVRFKVTLIDGLNSARRCTCTYCSMRGAIAVSASLEGIEFTCGEEFLTLYQFNTGAAKHYFCSICGIYTHHQRRSNPSQLGINASCLKGVSPFDFEQLVVLDGINHPADTNQSANVAGILRFSKE